MAWLARARARDVVIAAQPDEVLLHSVAVLRGLGARITRYDVEEGTLEARVRRFLRPALIRVRAAPEGTGATRVSLESDALGWPAMFRRVRGDLQLLERRP